MFKYLFRKNALVIAFFILAPISAICSIAVSTAMAAAIDYANGGQLADIWKYLIVFGGYILFDLLIDQSFKYVRYHILKKTMLKLRSDVYDHVVRMDNVKFGMRNTADHIAALTSDMELLRDSYFSVILDMYIDLLRFVLAASYLFYLSPVLGTFILVTTILQSLVPLLFAPKLELAGQSYSNAQEKHMVTLKENLSAFLTAKVFHIEDRLASKYYDALDSSEEQKRSMLTMKVWASNISFVFSRITHLGVFLLGAVLAIGGNISASAIVAASQLVVYISGPIYTLNRNLTEIRSTKAPAKKLADLLGQPYDVGGQQALRCGEDSIAVRQLCFSYRDKVVLADITCRFDSGKKYLIVGGSGSGKSTLLNLIAGLRNDYTGSICVGGTEIRDLSRESLTNHLCYISQEPFLFDDTLYNNICLFSSIPEETVMNVLGQVGLSDFVRTLPQGIHTRVGESASIMSGGEKQRVAVARAMIFGSRILLLDESTCHLDPATASSIERLVLGMENMTVLLVSHNATPTAKELADVIYEMKNGRLCVR